MNTWRTWRRRERGLTLVELLAALVVLSLFVALGGGWLISSSQAIAIIDSETDRGVASARTLTYLLDDLDAAAPLSLQVDDDSISLSTLNPSPGSTAGWSRVTWRNNDRGEVLRSATTLDSAEASDTEALPVMRAVLEIIPLDASTPPRALLLRVEASSGASIAVWEAL